MSDSLKPYELLYARLPCPLVSPWVCSNSCPLTRWCHPTISSFVAPFSSCPQSFLASRSFPMCQLIVSGGQLLELHPTASVVPMNIWGWFTLGLTGLIPLLSKGLLRVPGNARRSYQLILKKIDSKYSLEGLMLKLKLQYFGHLMQRTDSFEKT